MAAFQYTALDNKGKIQKGVIEADSDKQARQLLRSRGLKPMTLTSSKRVISVGKTRFKRRRVSIKEITLLTRQLATLLTAGLPLEEVLATVSEQSEKQSTQGLVLAVRSKVLEGHTLASSMRDFPEAFSDLYCSTVAAGEKSGHLDTVLQRLADYTEQQYNMRQKIKNALIYPTLMVLVSISIVGFLLEYVVPKMIAVYSNVGQKLPPMTRVLIAISTVVTDYGIYILIVLALLIYLFRRQMKKSIPFKTKVHRFMLRIPLIGNAIKVSNTARFSKTFAILSSAGVPVLDAMRNSSALITNIPIRKAIEEATNRVREGANINLALKLTTYFPPMSIHLIASGESSGQLENMLERAATNQENEIASLIDTSLTLFEPMIILVMGSVVLFIVLAVLLPIFQLNEFTG